MQFHAVGPSAPTNRLTFIRHARELGFEIDAIRALVTLQDDPNQPCGTADVIAKARLVEVEQRIRSLTALKAELEVMVEGCRHGRVTTCRVIEVTTDNASTRITNQFRLALPPCRAGQCSRLHLRLDIRYFTSAAIARMSRTNSRRPIRPMPQPMPSIPVIIGLGFLAVSQNTSRHR